MMIEWLTFVCTHARGPDWKIPDEDFPTICKLVMANGKHPFKTLFRRKTSVVELAKILN